MLIDKIIIILRRYRQIEGLSGIMIMNEHKIIKIYILPRKWPWVAL